MMMLMMIMIMMMMVMVMVVVVVMMMMVMMMIIKTLKTANAVNEDSACLYVGSQPNLKNNDDTT